MPSFYKGSIPIIDDSTPTDRLFDPVIDGQRVKRGLIPRDYTLYPPEMFAPPDQMKVIDPSEWDARYDEQEAQESSLEHLYLQDKDHPSPVFINLDQNGDGYCWAYSTGHAIMMERLRSNMPLVRLNPHATAAIIKHGQDEGGWCGLSAEFAAANGYAVEGNAEGQWPLQSRNLKYDTPQVRAEMRKHRVVENWVDPTRDVYDVQLATNQYATSLFHNNPSPSDFNWWGHSVCAIRWVRIEKGSWGPLIINSWKGWGRFGLAVLQGYKGRPDSCLSIRTTTPSMN
jgi:hypothetical protein